MGKYDKYIVKPFDWGERPLIGHNRKVMNELGPLMAFLNEDMVKDTDLDVFIHFIDVKSDDGPEYVEPHVHDFSQAYIFPEEGLTFEVELDGEKYVKESPITVFIPAGVKHTIRMIKGKGFEVSLTRTSKYHWDESKS